jgi:serine-type D-Ala-D-Ala carboxypeptidase (penicillin-binding protein 5/6)
MDQAAHPAEAGPEAAHPAEAGPEAAHPAEADLVDQSAHPAEEAHPAAEADSAEADSAEADSAEADSAEADSAVVAAPGEAEAVGAAEAAADATISARGRTYNRRPQRRQPSSLANRGLPSRNCPPPSGHSSRGVIGWVMRCGECETPPTEKR